MISKIYKPAFSLFSLLTPGQKKGGLICLGAMLFLAFMEIAAASLIVAMASQITSPGEGDYALSFLAIVCLGVFIVKGAAALLDSYAQNKWIQTLILDFKERLITRYVEMDYAHQVTLNSGRSLSVLYNDADIYLRIALSSFGVLFTETSLFIVLMGFLFFLQPAITAILLVIFAGLGGVFILCLLPAFKRWGKTVQETVEAGYRAALLVLQSYKDILIFGKTKYFVDRYMKQSLLRAEVTVKSSVSQIVPRVALETIFIAFFAGLVLYFLWTDKEISELTTVLSAYLYAGFRLLPGLNRMVVQVNNIKMSEASLERIVTELHSPIHKSVYLSKPDLDFKKSIDVKGVSFRYPGTEKDVLGGVDLQIKKGEFIGIIGETGSGKSTLLHLLLGLLLPGSGDVLIDNKHPANSVQWHSRIGYAAQNFHLIDGTIADNIAFGVSEEARDEALIRQVIEDAQLERFVAKLPAGIDTEIGEKGALISGGERQRIALARALYQKPDVLMLDEATSALDLETEASIMKTIEALKEKDLTIIAVTHRLDTLKNVDRVVLIEEGQIVKDIKGSEMSSLKKKPSKKKEKND